MKIVTKGISVRYDLWDYAEKHHMTIEGLEKPVNDMGEKEESIEEEY